MPFDEKVKVYEDEMKFYNRNVSIIALISAIVILMLSLTFSRKLMVVADGLLLGGVITLLYSVARVFGSGDDKLRFLIVTISLGVALILGYFKFIKESSVKKI